MSKKQLTAEELAAYEENMREFAKTTPAPTYFDQLVEEAHQGMQEWAEETYEEEPGYTNRW